MITEESEDYQQGNGFNINSNTEHKIDETLIPTVSIEQKQK